MTVIAMSRLDFVDRHRPYRMPVIPHRTIGIEDREPDAQTASHESGNPAAAIHHRFPLERADATATSVGPHNAEVTPNTFASPSDPTARRSPAQTGGLRKAM
jgi:hypothetical protein